MLKTSSRLDSSDNCERMGSHSSSHGNKGHNVTMISFLPSALLYPVQISDEFAATFSSYISRLSLDGVTIISSHPAYTEQTTTVRSLDNLTDIPLDIMIGITHQVVSRHNLLQCVDNSVKINGSYIGIEITVQCLLY